MSDLVVSTPRDVMAWQAVARVFGIGPGEAQKAFRESGRFIEAAEWWRCWDLALRVRHAGHRDDG